MNDTKNISIFTVLLGTIIGFVLKILFSPLTPIITCILLATYAAQEKQYLEMLIVLVMMLIIQKK